MKQHTPVCAQPTKIHPQGRTGTDAGRQAHYAVGEAPCAECLRFKKDAQALMNERARELAKDLARTYFPVCLAPSKRHPDGRRGTDAGYQLHVKAGTPVCSPCREAHKERSAVARSAPGYSEKRRAEYQLNKRAHAERNIARFGITLDDYVRILESQGGVCAICGSTDPFGKGRRFHVDHDHSCCPGQKSCGRCVRGLLCGRCNPGLGAFDDDPDRLLSAAAYLLQTRDVLMEVKSDAADQAGGGAPEEADPAGDAAS